MSHLRHVSTLRQAGKTRLLLSMHIHPYARAYACLPTFMRIARVRLHVYPTRDGRAPDVGRRAPSRRVGSLSLLSVSRFAPEKVMSGVHWAPIDKGRRSSTFLSPVSPPPARARAAIYMARRLARAGDGITSLYVPSTTPYILPVLSATLFYSLPEYRTDAPLLFNAECTKRLNSRSRILKSEGGSTGIFQSFWL